MPSRGSQNQSWRFVVEERQQKVSDINAMIDDFTRVAEELDRQIAQEEQRAGISDITHFAYPIYAKAARQRRDNLQHSIRDLQAKLEEAETELEEARSRLQSSELAANRDNLRSRGSVGNRRFPANLAFEGD